METPHVDDAFRALSNPFRRRLLLALLDQKPHDKIIVPGEIDLSETDPHRLETALFHNHLPMLADLGVIEWEQDSHMVSKGSNFEAIQPLLELIDNHRDELPDGWI